MTDTFSSVLPSFHTIRITWFYSRTSLLWTFWDPAFEHHVTSYKFVIYNFKSTNTCGEHAIIIMEIRVVPIDTNFQI